MYLLLTDTQAASDSSPKRTDTDVNTAGVDTASTQNTAANNAHTTNTATSNTNTQNTTNSHRQVEQEDELGLDLDPADLGLDVDAAGSMACDNPELRAAGDAGGNPQPADILAELEMAAGVAEPDNNVGLAHITTATTTTSTEVPTPLDNPSRF